MTLAKRVENAGRRWTKLQAKKWGKWWAESSAKLSKNISDMLAEKAGESRSKSGRTSAMAVEL